jgi:hypothetical protein
MKSAIILSTIAFMGIQAQGDLPKGGAKGAKGAKGGNSDIMSALGSKYQEKGVPLGPAPTGCSAFEVLFGTFSNVMTIKTDS